MRKNIVLPKKKRRPAYAKATAGRPLDKLLITKEFIVFNKKITPQRGDKNHLKKMACQP